MNNLTHCSFPLLTEQLKWVSKPTDFFKLFFIFFVLAHSWFKTSGTGAWRTQGNIVLHSMRIATLIQAMCQLNWSQILDRLRFSFLWHLTFLALNAVLLHMDLYKFVTGYVLTTRPLSFEGFRLTWMVYLYLTEFLTTFMWLLNLVFSVRVSKSNRGRAVLGMLNLLVSTGPWWVFITSNGWNKANECQIYFSPWICQLIFSSCNSVVCVIIWWQTGFTLHLTKCILGCL